MNTVFLNGEFLPATEARISPMDRGFLFGDGIYEVIPCHHGKPVGFSAHMARLRDGLRAIAIDTDACGDNWADIIDELQNNTPGDHLGIYIHVSRGADTRRNHAMPAGITPTRFAYAFEIPPPPEPDKALATPFSVETASDLRWQRCQIKSTSLLGNVLHYQHARDNGYSETLLFNGRDELTEAAACNVFVLRAGRVATPALDQQKLPGITRAMLLDILRRHSDFVVEERSVSRQEVLAADEVWLTSSSKEVAPVVMIDGAPVGRGGVGDGWLAAQTLFARHRFDY